MCKRLGNAIRLRSQTGLQLEFNDVKVDRNTYSRDTSAWVECLWGWDGFWQAKKDTNHQVLIKSQQNWLKQGVEQFALRSFNLVILLVPRENFLSSGRCQLLYLLIGRVIKLTVAVIKAYHYIQSFIQHPAAKVTSIFRRNYWRSSVSILMQQLNYWPYILHLSNTWE